MKRDDAGRPRGSIDLASVAVSAPARNHAGFIWSIADLLRGDYKKSEYGRVILPLTVLRRLDGVLAPTKERALEKNRGLPKRFDAILNRVTGVQFNNTSELDLRRVLDDPANAADQLRQYVAGFSENVREVFEKCDLDAQITRLDASNLLYLVLGKFVDADLGPETVSNTEIGYIYEELVRRFSELSNETAGEHFTPREVVELMVNLLFIEDDDLLSRPGKDDRDLFGLHLNQAVINAFGEAAAVNVGQEILSVGGRDICRVHVKPSSFPVDANVVEVDGKGQHVRKTVFYGRFGNGTRAITDQSERERYQVQVWGN